MTSKALNNKKKKEEREQGRARRSKQKQQILSEAENDDKKCPVFSVQYLGKTPAGGEYGREFIKEPVETLLRLKDRRPKQHDSALHISEKGFHFLDKNGPFGKEKHVLIPIHHICYGVNDEQHPHVFAIITRTDSSSENSLFDCHAFWCGHKKTAQEVTYWLLQTFLQVFNSLQRKRKDRQDRKLRKQKEAAAREASSPASSPQSPDAINMTMYSVILEKPSKRNGAAVRLTRNSRPSTVSSHNSVLRVPPSDTTYMNTNGSDRDETLNGNATMDSSMYQLPQNLSSGPARPSPKRMRAPAPPPPVIISPEGTEDGSDFTHDPRPLTIVTGRSVGSTNSRSSYPNINDQPIPEYKLPSAMGPTHLLSPPHSRQRYEKRPGSRTSSGISPSQGSGSSYGSMTRESAKEGDFIFIDMLQEAFSDIGASDSASRAGRKWLPKGRRTSGSSSNSGVKIPTERLTSDDIEKRIRQWLIDGEEPNNNVAEDRESLYSNGPFYGYTSSSYYSSGLSTRSSSTYDSTHVSGTFGGAEDKHYF